MFVVLVFVVLLLIAWKHLVARKQKGMKKPQKERIMGCKTATKEINVAFPAGYDMSWYVTTQAGNKVTVKLFDDTTVYFEKSKQGTEAMPPLDYGVSKVKGNNLKVKITVESCSEDQIKSAISGHNIITPSGREVGKGMHIAIEDWTDNDYNDVSISLLAWKR
jgi:hypothetical protein